MRFGNSHYQLHFVLLLHLKFFTVKRFKNHNINIHIHSSFLLKRSTYKFNPNNQSVMYPKIGVLGGGQLGRMMVEAANNLHVPVAILDKKGNPASKVSSWVEHIEGDFQSAPDIEKLAQSCQVLTVEIEHVDVQALYHVKSKYPQVEIHPSPNTIALIQDKYAQKVHLDKFNVPMPEFKEVNMSNPEQSIIDIAKKFGYPLMLKSKRLAYDGRGNYAIKSSADIQKAVSLLGGSKGDLYVEKWVPFTAELAIMIAKDKQGQLASYPVVETIQKDNICHLVIAPAQAPMDAQYKAQIVAEQAIAALDGCGIFGVEMFLLEDGSVLLNEIAPRPHNSGHYTIEACHTSQFEQHMRIVAGLPMGSTKLQVPFAAMLNILGEADGEEGSNQIMSICENSLCTEGASIHLYGKSDCKKGRKMGHITVVANTFEELKRSLDNVSPANERMEKMKASPMVGIIMGSDSDLPSMRAAALILEEFGVPFELTIVSAHRTPERMIEYGQSAHKRGIKVIIAGAGGAAHLPGMVAAITPLPVIGVPVALKYLDGMDSLYSIVQMPRGVPVATVAINNSTNAGLLAVRILGCSGHPLYLDRLIEYKKMQQEKVMGAVSKLEQGSWKNY